MSDAWPSIKLKVFEHVVTGPSQSLLRVSGKASRRRAGQTRPALVVITSSGEQRIGAIPAPPDEGGTVRAAYAIPTALLDGDPELWLEAAGGKRTRLPKPTPSAARRRDADDSPAADDVSGETPSESGTAPDEMRRLEQRVAELERDREHEQRAAAAGVAEAEARAEAAQERARAAETEAESAAARALSAEASAQAAREEATEASARLELLERRAAELEQADQARQARIAALEHELAGVAPAREALQREFDQLRARHTSLERELDQSRDQLRIMTFERDELARQAAAFDEVAVKARGRAAQAEAANEKAAAALRELEVWRGELERRLADTTSELGAARAAREADEREFVRLRAALTEHERGAVEAGGGANGGDTTGDSATVAAQAEEIERLAAELAVLRARAAREG